MLKPGSSVFSILPPALASVLLCSNTCAAPLTGESRRVQAAASPVNVVAFEAQPAAEALRGIGRGCSADFNNDGRADYAGVRQLDPPAAAGVRSRLRIALSATGDTWSNAQELPLPGEPKHLLATADIDGDADLDLAAIAHDETTAWLLFGDGSGRFTLQAEPVDMAPGVHPHSHSLAIADVNNDTWPDLLSGNADGNSISVMLNHDGRFRAATGSPFPAGEHPYEGLRALKVNGDPNLDLVISNIMGNTVTVLLGNGAGGFAFAAGSPHPAGTRPGYIAAGDLNGDGLADLAVTYDDFPLASIFLGDGKGGLSTLGSQTFELPRRAWPLEIADVNNDGSGDLLFAGDAGSLSIHYGPLRGLPLPAEQRVNTKASFVSQLHLADLNADQRLDIIAIEDAGQNGVVLLQVQP
jgi:hypothetical protein